MTCGEFEDCYELYALGVLDGVERDELEEHLSRNCGTCMDKMKRALQNNAFVLKSVPELEPPPKLRARVLAGFGVKTPSFWGRALPWTLAAAALALFLITALPRTKNAPDENNAGALALLNTPGTRQFSFGGQALGPHGSVLVSPEKGIMLIVGNLAAPPSGKMYETWIVPKAGTPQPKGQLTPASNGLMIGIISGPVSPSEIKAVAVSLEIAGSSPQVPASVIFAAATE